ncbi:MAG: hypothetical protein O7H40_04455, partial [Gammaproteobacteria bacterium]|nr:hypothetical protein [Gammaproteobacteria bacterium]
MDDQNPGRNLSEPSLSHEKERLQNLELDYQLLELHNRHLEKSILAISDSPYWKLTAPLRKAAAHLLSYKHWLGRRLDEYAFGRFLLHLKNRRYGPQENPALDVKGVKEKYDHRARH